MWNRRLKPVAVVLAIAAALLAPPAGAESPNSAFAVASFASPFKSPLRDIQRIADATPESGVLVQGRGGASQDLSLENLAAMPHITQKPVLKNSAGAEEMVEFSGPLLWDVIAASGTVDMAKHAEHVRLTLHVFGKDSYSAAFVLAEFSPEFGGKPIILADQMSGAALPGQALRLIVPGEKRGGRSVRDVVRITFD